MTNDDVFPWTDEDRFGTARAEALEGTEFEMLPADPVQAEEREGIAANRGVSSSTRFDDIAGEYVALFREAVILPQHLGHADQRWSVLWYAKQISQSRSRYDALSSVTSIPWFLIGILHALECSFAFDRHLFNGDPLSDYTKRYPPGHPKDKGKPPFSFDDSAVAALQFDGFVGQTDWSLARTLHRLEAYNGMSYRAKLRMASPYLWSFSNLYLKGKFKEVPKPGGGYRSIYDPELRSKQCGAAVMLKALIDRGDVTFPTS